MKSSTSGRNSAQYAILCTILLYIQFDYNKQHAISLSYIRSESRQQITSIEQQTSVNQMHIHFTVQVTRTSRNTCVKNFKGKLSASTCPIVYMPHFSPIYYSNVKYNSRWLTEPPFQYLLQWLVLKKPSRCSESQEKLYAKLQEIRISIRKLEGNNIYTCT